MIGYHINSRELLDIVSDIKRRRLILSPYFQRDFVWRTVHKVDFIDTILRGYPFPQIFIAKGDVDVETMTSTSCVVDGQQRLNAILGFIDNQFQIDGRSFSDLGKEEKEVFLRYKVPLIELDVKHDDPDIIEIFKRLNRTFYSLSNIERLATEFASSEFMMVAKLLCNDLHKFRKQPTINFIVDEEDEPPVGNVGSTSPVEPPSFYEWAEGLDLAATYDYLLGERVFTGYEISRKVHLMFTLNVLATVKAGFYARNEMVVPLLQSLTDEYAEKDEIVRAFDAACSFLTALGYSRDDYWSNKANAFSLIVVFMNRIDQLAQREPAGVRQALDSFYLALPADYRASAKEAVNNKRERILRNEYLERIIFGVEARW